MSTTATSSRHSSLPVRSLSGLAVPSAFSPYAIAFFDANAQKATFQATRTVHSAKTLLPSAQKFIKQLHFGLRLRGLELDLPYIVFTPKKRNTLAFELSVVSHRACYLIETESDEIIGLRYLAADIALAKTHRKVSATKTFCKPTKRSHPYQRGMPRCLPQSPRNLRALFKSLTNSEMPCGQRLMKHWL